jgi:hypothetical protein
MSPAMSPSVSSQTTLLSGPITWQPFIRSFPVARLFCESVISPPALLKGNVLRSSDTCKHGHPLRYSSTAKAFLGCSRWSDNVCPGFAIVKTDQHELASARAACFPFCRLGLCGQPPGLWLKPFFCSWSVYAIVRWIRFSIHCDLLGAAVDSYQQLLGALGSHNHRTPFAVDIPVEGNDPAKWTGWN